MPYGIIKIDTVTFTDAGVDKSVSISGLVQNPTFSGNVTVTGTLSGVTVTGTTANFTSGNFTNISGGTHTITSGVFAAGSAASPSITFTGDLNTGIYSPGADQVAISTGGSPRVTVTSTGVGIGTANPGAYSGQLVVNISPSGDHLVFGDDSTSSGAAAARLGCSGNNLVFKTNSGGSAATERLRITAAGLVGVGTSSVDRLFIASDSVDNNLPCAVITKAVTGGANSGLQVHTAGTDAGAGAYCFRVTAGNTYGSPTSEYLRVTAAGRVGIGTASPQATLHAHESGSVTARIRITNSTTTDATGRGLLLSQQGTSAYITNNESGVLAVSNNGSEAFRVDSDRRLLVGTSSDLSGGVANTSFQLAASSGSGVSTLAQIYSFNSGGGVAALDLCRSKSTTLGTNTTVANNDYIGSLNFKGANGSSYLAAASVSCEIDGAVSGGGAADMPGRLVFSTTADGASSPTERVRITSTGQVSIASGLAVIDTATSNAPYLSLVSGPTNATGAELRMGARTNSSSTSAGIKAIHPDGADPDYVSIALYVRNSGTSTDPALEIARADYQGSFRPGADNARPLGNASFRWSEVFAGTGTINTSDETLKENIQDLEQAELSVAAEIKSLIKRFRFKDAVARKGDDARIHVGVIAQEVEQAFVDNGIDPRRYALFCEDTLEDGSKRLGIRYDELLAFVIAAL